MSDEREGAEGDGDNTTRSGQTAVVTRPVRPSGKRSRQQITEPQEAEPIERVGKTKGRATKDGTKVKAKTAKKRDGESRNPIAYVINYMRQVVAEMRKVIWPNRKQMVSYTSVVLVFLAFMVALIGVVDLGLAKLVLMVFG